MPAEVYDQVVGGVKASQSAADGFVAHYGIVEEGGITVCRDLGLDRSARRLVQ